MGLRLLTPLDLPRISRLDMRPLWAQLLPIKYVVYPGYVSSRHDQDRHFIGAEQLMRFYGV